MEGFIGNDLAWTVPFIGYLGLLNAYYWPLTYRMLKLDAEAHPVNLKHISVNAFLGFRVISRPLTLSLHLQNQCQMFLLYSVIFPTKHKQY